MAAMREIMKRLKLTVNETKTRTCRLPDESFDLLVYPGLFMRAVSCSTRTS
jgi:hypothetical protein